MSIFSGCDKPRFDEERRISHDDDAKATKENDSSVMEEVNESELQVSIVSFCACCMFRN